MLCQVLNFGIAVLELLRACLYVLILPLRPLCRILFLQGTCSVRLLRRGCRLGGLIFIHFLPDGFLVLLFLDLEAWSLCVALLSVAREQKIKLLILVRRHEAL